LVRLAEKYRESQERKNIIPDKNKVFLGENLEKGGSRKDILQLEKKLVDLELAVTELKESISSIDVSMVPDLKQRLDDVEDLIMVEQAGIIELKKMLDESKPEKPTIPEGLEGRLKSIEDNIPNLVEKTELESRLEEVQKELPKEEKPAPVEIEGLYDKITGLETSLSELKSQTDNISKELYEKFNEISLKATGVKKSPIDIDLLSSKIETGKRSIDELYKKKLELDLKVEEISKKMEILENNMGESPGQELLDGLKLNRREIVATNARIDSLERVARELMGDVQNFEKSIRNFESIEKISLLSKNIEEKLERSRFIEEEIKRLASKVEMIYDEIDKKFGKLRGLEKDYSESISELMESNEANKKEILKIKKGETGNFEKIIQESRNAIENMRKTQSEYLAETDKKIYEYIDNKLESTNKKSTSVDISPLIGRINSLTEEYKNFAGDVSKKIISMENIKPVVEKRIEELTKTLQPMIKKEIEPMERRMRETRLDEVNRILTDVTTKIAVIESKLSSMEKNYGNKVAEVPKMQEKVIVRESRFLEEQFKEVVNRMIFLESRLIAVEGMMHEKSQALPIIIE